MKQRSPEWFKKRAPMITASRFKDVIAGKNTINYQTYLQSFVDYAMGYPSFVDKDGPWYNHGKEWEAEARADWDFRKYAEYPDKNVRSKDIGFVVHPDFYFIGGSPDFQTVADPRGKGGGEIKCHKSIEQWEFFKDKFPAVHKPQVQGQLWITGWKFIDFISYFKSIKTGRNKTTIHEVRPDKEYHKFLEQRCLAFWDDVQRSVSWEKV